LRLRRALPLLLAVLAASCGGGPPSPESVVRAWNEAVNSGNNEAAGRLFAPGARVVQAGRVYTLADRRDAVAFNAGLPCSAEIVSIATQGQTVTATFALADRDTSPCDAPGVEVTAVFEIRDGKIVVWQQLPGSNEKPPGEPV
jgi:limonene-1,2-epoxide hydrolase